MVSQVCGGCYQTKLGGRRFNTVVSGHEPLDGSSGEVRLDPFPRCEAFGIVCRAVVDGCVGAGSEQRGLHVSLSAVVADHRLYLRDAFGCAPGCKEFSVKVGGPHDVRVVCAYCDALRGLLLEVEDHGHVVTTRFAGDHGVGPFEGEIGPSAQEN